MWEFAAHLHPEQRLAMSVIRGSPHLPEVLDFETKRIIDIAQVKHAVPPPLHLARGDILD